MNFLEVLDIAGELLSLASAPSPRKRSKVLVIFSFLLVISFVGFLIVLHWILMLYSPVWFLILFIVVGFVLTVGIVILIYQLDWIAQITLKEFIVMLMSIILTVITAATVINKAYATSSSGSKICRIVNEPENGIRNKVTIATAEGQLSVPLPAAKGKTLHANDLIWVEEMDGFLGFDFAEVEGLQP